VKKTSAESAGQSTAGFSITFLAPEAGVSAQIEGRDQMALTLYGRIGLLAMAAILTGPRVASPAPILVGVEASSTSGDFADLSTGAGPVMSGTAFADKNEGHVHIENAPLPACPTCGISATQPYGFARAEANGSTGSLKVRAIASPATNPNAGEAFAKAQAGLSDVINFLGGPPIIDVHLDLTQFFGNSSVTFSMTKKTSPDTFATYFLFEAEDDWYQIFVNDQLVEEGSAIPSVLDYSIENLGFSWFGFDAFFRASASGAGQVIADNSVYLGIKGPYISANGFSYPGVAIEPTPGTPVPEPATLLLVGAGLIGAVRRRRRPRDLPPAPHPHETEQPDRP
jgi:hypothetical protein